ncbi:LrgA-associated membrane protein LrgB [Vibrio crassostreae]|nr:LrgA-associated membrane protein LrgB [Vibrio crassostreae]
MWLIITIATYFFAKSLVNKFNIQLIPPIIISLILLIVFLLLSETEYEVYYKQSHWLSMLLELGVVALSFPLYHQFRYISHHWKLLVITCLTISIMSMVISLTLANVMGADQTLMASMLSQFITTPMAVNVSESLGGEPSVTAIIVLFVGLFGSCVSYPIFHYLRIKTSISRGIPLGAASHVIGTARGMEHSSTDGAFSTVSLVLCGTFTSILSPLAWGCFF